MKCAVKNRKRSFLFVQKNDFTTEKIISTETLLGNIQAFPHKDKEVHTKLSTNERIIEGKRFWIETKF